MISDQCKNTVFFSELLPERMPQLWAELSSVLSAHGYNPNLLSGTRDIWVRDFLPMQTTPTQFVQFKYSPNYLRDFDTLRTRPDEVRGLPVQVAPSHSPLVIDGGNVVGSPKRAIVTDKIYSENHGLPRSHIREQLRTALGVGELIVIPKEPYDVFGHADGMVRFLTDELVLVNDYRTSDPGYAERLENVLRKHDLQIKRLPYLPQGIGGADDVPSASGNHINFLWLGPLLLLPAYGKPNSQAEHILTTLLPETEIVSIECTDLANAGGVLNCCSWTADLSSW